MTVKTLATSYIQPDTRAAVDRRLKSVAGQVSGLQRMLADDRPCMDLLVQVAAVHEAMRQVAKLIMRNYLENCATEGIRSDDPAEREAVYDEIMNAMYRFAR